MDKEIKHISVLGLGKLGLPLAAALASRGYHVSGIDNDTTKVSAFQRGEFYYETQLDEHIAQGSERLTFSTDLNAVIDSSVTFVIIPTPSAEDGSFSIDYLKTALEDLGRVLKQKNSFHVISIVSTVLPGNMEVLKKALEGASEKKCGQDFGLCYNPAFIALGNVIHNFLNPDFILIGESDEKAGSILDSIFLKFCDNTPAIHRMNFINAEITKISLNTYVTMKISFGNTLARICEKLPEADAEVVAKALGSDSRIGHKYLRGALGYGGPCFPRDNRAFSCMGRKVGIPAYSAEATDQVNEFQVTWLLDLVKSYATESDVIGIWGLSYKQDTDVIEESQGIKLAQALCAENRHVVVYDPAAQENASKVLGDSVGYATSAVECFKASNVIVITTPWHEFSKLGDDQLKNDSGKKKIIIDCWQNLKHHNFPDNVEHIMLGKTIIREQIEDRVVQP